MRFSTRGQVAASNWELRRWCGPRRGRQDSSGLIAQSKLRVHSPVVNLVGTLVPGVSSYYSQRTSRFLHPFVETIRIRQLVSRPSAPLTFEGWSVKRTGRAIVACGKFHARVRCVCMATASRGKRVESVGYAQTREPCIFISMDGVFAWGSEDAIQCDTAAGPRRHGGMDAGGVKRLVVEYTGRTYVKQSESGFQQYVARGTTVMGEHTCIYHETD